MSRCVKRVYLFVRIGLIKKFSDMKIIFDHLKAIESSFCFQKLYDA